MRDVHPLPLVGLQLAAARADHPTTARPGPLLDTVMMVRSELTGDFKFIIFFQIFSPIIIGAGMTLAILLLS